MAVLPRYAVVTRDGVKLDRYTAQALAHAEKALGFPLALAQGSYNVGVAASAGTHDGGGVFDAKIRGLSAAKIKRIVNQLKDSGFAAWERKEVAGLWGPHIHAVLVGNARLAQGAKAQVESFLRHRDGLRGDGWDATYRPDPPVVFSYVRGKPVKA